VIRSAAACLPVASVMSCDHTTLSAPIVIMIIIIVLIIIIIIIIIIYRRSSESFLPDHSCQLPTRPVLWSHKTLPSAAKQVNRHIQDATKYRGQWTTAGHKRSPRVFCSRLLYKLASCQIAVSQHLFMQEETSHKQVRDTVAG